MKKLSGFLLAVFLTMGQIISNSWAGEQDPAFINLTTDDPVRANLGIVLGKSFLEGGHPLTIFLNDKGVFVGSQSEAAKFADQQKMLGELIEKGAVVFICPMCMEHYNVKESELISGLTAAKPSLISEALFKDGTQTLTW